MSNRNIHPSFQQYLDLKSGNTIELYKNLRSFVLNLYPNANEFLYHTHALTSVYSITDKLKHGFCHIPIYTNHLNLGFNKGALLKDENKLLIGTGKLIRHIPIVKVEDYNNKNVIELLERAIELAQVGVSLENTVKGQCISKIK